MKKLILYLLLFAFAAPLLSGCVTDTAKVPETSDENTGITEEESTEMKNGYKQITQEEAAEMMKKNDGHIVVDVRRQDEFDEGHIPGAICIPNESITDEKPAGLPDTDRIILVYCRSGRRSKEAAQKLSDMGYKNVYEFGGIIDWKGETVTEMTETGRAENTAVLVITAGEKTFYGVLDNNPSAKAFVEKLSPTVLELEMSDYGGIKITAELPWILPRSDAYMTARPGDIILDQDNQISIYYDERAYSFTRLANIGNMAAKELRAALGDDGVKIAMSLEWSE